MMVQLSLEQNMLKLTGQLNYLNAAQCYQDGFNLLKSTSSKEILVDLSELEQATTLVLAIFIQWIRQLPQKHLMLSKIPDKMLGILRASHLEHLQTM